MAIKGQKYKTYSEEIKKEAVRLHVIEGWTYRKINEHLGINDPQRMKKWMRKFREQGEFGLVDQRGRREAYIDQDRYVQKLKRGKRNAKKVLGNLDAGGEKQNIKSLR
ncbi:helix-turn-helix domain-containing protein [Paenibacillus glucanolyticus]|uniref:helix-turn-helix domain-containing protein n=1 Tax=Paenibacillus glucanolyticus TaxID=59843 RepID=UPI000AC126CC|nr:transposase [Paenibacillus glucanolyticus]